MLGFTCFNKGPSIYEVRTEGKGSGSGGRVWMGCQRLVDVHKKLEPTDVIVSSSHGKKFVFFCTRMLSLDRIKYENFSSI